MLVSYVFPEKYTLLVMVSYIFPENLFGAADERQISAF